MDWISPDARHHSSQGNGLGKDTVLDPRLQPSRGSHMTPDNLLDLQRETTQVEQRRIWPWHHQEVYVTGNFGFSAVRGEMDCHEIERDGRPVVEFSWEGHDECNPAAVRGWAVLE